MGPRKADLERRTKETRISAGLNLDGSGQVEAQTGVGFFDHMLTSAMVHGFFDLSLKAEGDTHVDDHHTVEDVGIVLGQAFARAKMFRLLEGDRSRGKLRPVHHPAG